MDLGVFIYLEISKLTILGLMNIIDKILDFNCVICNNRIGVCLELSIFSPYNGAKYKINKGEYE